MSAPPSTPPAAPPGRRPAWELALLYPDQGQWSESEYIDLSNDTNHLIEFTDGRLEFLPMPKRRHQKLLWWLGKRIESVAQASPGAEFFIAPYKLRIRDGKYREPDVLLILAGKGHRVSEDFTTGADLLIEVVSPDNPERDYEEKRRDYAEARVPEYWIVDPAREVITVLVLRDSAYVEHGIFSSGEHATSVLIPTFSVDVSACLAAGD